MSNGGCCSDWRSGPIDDLPRGVSAGSGNAPPPVVYAGEELAPPPHLAAQTDRACYPAATPHSQAPQIQGSYFAGVRILALPFALQFGAFRILARRIELVETPGLEPGSAVA